MNRIVMIGRLTKDPELRYSQGENQTAIARYTLAVDRRYKGRDGQPAADFIPCVAFGKAAEFAGKYLHKGMKMAVAGHIQTGSYEKDGVKHYTTDVVIEEQEFCESKGNGNASRATGQDGVPEGQQIDGGLTTGQQVDGGIAVGQQVDADGFVNIPEGLDEELPFA